MKAKFAMVVAVAAMVLAISGPLSAPLSAHHGTAAFDMEKKVTMKVTVAKWLWANPHCVLQFDAKDDSGNVVHWATETSNPSDMTNAGWTRDTLKPGDEITVTVFPAKNGKPIGRIATVTLASGQTLGNGFATP